MSIFRKAMPNGKQSPTYHYRFVVGGKRFTGSTGCSTKRDAEKFEREKIEGQNQQKSARALVENFRDVLAGDRVVPLAKAFKLFVAKPKKKAIGEKQLRSKETYWHDFLAFMQDHHPQAKRMSDVTREMAEDYIQELRANGKYVKEIQYRSKGGRKEIGYTNPSRELSPRTCNVYHKTLQQIFDVLFRDASLRENPFSQIPNLANEYEARDAFTPEELKKIGENADALLYPIFAIGMSTGLREGDICTLKWSEVDLAGGWVARKMRKTGKSVRIPILPSLRPYLAELWEQRAPGAEYVLPKQAEVYLTNPSGISYRVRQFLESDAIGIATTRNVPGRSRAVSVKDVHSLRHTFCYMAAVNGVPANIVQSIVGHMDARITQMYMDHVNDEIKRDKLNHMPNYLGLPESACDEFQLAEPSSYCATGGCPDCRQTLAEIRNMTDDNWREIRDKLLAQHADSPAASARSSAASGA